MLSELQALQQIWVDLPELLLLASYGVDTRGFVLRLCDAHTGKGDVAWG